MSQTTDDILKDVDKKIVYIYIWQVRIVCLQLTLTPWANSAADK